jgi:hypothetical protein
MDTTEFNRVIAAYHRAYSVLEGRNECYDRFMQNPEDDDCLEELFDNSSGFTDLISSDQTLLQLKNAGGFRLLDKSDADSILRYDKMIRLYAKDEMTGFQQNQYFIRETVFALRNYNRAKGQNGSVLYSDNRGLLNTYFNALNRWMLISQRLVRYLEALKMQAIELMGYFKRKYQFK